MYQFGDCDVINLASRTYCKSIVLCKAVWPTTRTSKDSVSFAIYTAASVYTPCRILPPKHLPHNAIINATECRASGTLGSRFCPTFRLKVT